MFNIAAAEAAILLGNCLNQNLTMIFNVVERSTQATGALPLENRLAHSSPELAVLCDLLLFPYVNQGQVTLSPAVSTSSKDCVVVVV